MFSWFSNLWGYGETNAQTIVDQSTNTTVAQINTEQTTNAPVVEQHINAPTVEQSKSVPAQSMALTCTECHDIGTSADKKLIFIGENLMCKCINTDDCRIKKLVTDHYWHGPAGMLVPWSIRVVLAVDGYNRVLWNGAISDLQVKTPLYTNESYLAKFAVRDTDGKWYYNTAVSVPEIPPTGSSPFMRDIEAIYGPFWTGPAGVSFPWSMTRVPTVDGGRETVHFGPGYTVTRTQTQGTRVPKYRNEDFYKLIFADASGMYSTVKEYTRIHAPFNRAALIGKTMGQVLIAFPFNTFKITRVNTIGALPPSGRHSHIVNVAVQMPEHVTFDLINQTFVPPVTDDCYLDSVIVDCTERGAGAGSATQASTAY